VSGSGKKLWRQKGTGRARIGSVRSPLWRHGGTVHGPTPRSYAYSLPKKMIAGALRSALSAKLADQKLTVVADWNLTTHKTKAFRATLSKLDGGASTVLLVNHGANQNFERASRNLQGVTVVPPAELVTYDLMRHDGLILSREAAEKISRGLSFSEEAKSGAAVQAGPAAEAAPEAKAKAAKRAAAKKTAKPKAAAKTAKPKSKKE
jgi:large subunit ribosomal protein L4